MTHCRVPELPLSERLGYDVGETAALINASVSFIHERIKRGELKTVKVAGRRIVPRWALEELLGCPIDAVLAKDKPPPALVSGAHLPTVASVRTSPSRAPPRRRSRSVVGRIKQEEGVT